MVDRELKTVLESHKNEVCCGTKTAVMVLLLFVGLGSFSQTEYANGIMWNFEIEDGTAILVKPTIDVATSGMVEIPSALGGKPVSQIGNSAFSGCKISGVTIPPSVTRICDNAFENCTHLLQVDIPEGVIEIDQWLFEGCSHLNKVILPHSLVWVGLGSFNTRSTPKTLLVEFHNPLQFTLFVGRSWASSTEHVVDMHFGDGISVIPRSEFSGCSYLTHVSFCADVNDLLL